MYKRLKYELSKIYMYAYYLLIKSIHKNKYLYLYWFNLHQNFGDTINPLFIKALSGKDVFFVNTRFSSIAHFSAIGSIIEHCSIDTTIWGSGFISQDSVLNNKPAKVLAVRGPKSRKRFLDLGIACPEVYGDPALLFPYIYKPKIEKKYTYGFVPHHSDFDNTWLRNNVSGNPDILIIDLQKDNVYDVIDDILSCEKIVSSSLHGVITADAYGIPSVWIEFSDKVIGKGFKFLDYFASVGRIDTSPLSINDTTKMSDIEALFYDYEIEIDLQKLLDAAPFDINICEVKR